MSRKHIEKRKKKEAKRDIKRTEYLHNTIDSTYIDDVDYRDIFDDAVQYEYGKPLIEYSEKRIDRIMVNGIRHNYSNYESNLKEIYKLGNDERFYIQYKNSVLDKISNTYPYLKEECDKQKRKCDMVKICK